MTPSFAKFSTGWNAGQRHANLAITPPDFTFDDKSPEFQTGYRIGWQDRKDGKVTDDMKAALLIEAGWNLFRSGAVIKSTARLPSTAGKLIIPRGPVSDPNLR